MLKNRKAIHSGQKMATAAHSPRGFGYAAVLLSFVAVLCFHVLHQAGLHVTRHPVSGSWCIKLLLTLSPTPYDHKSCHECSRKAGSGMRDDSADGVVVTVAMV
jgi:hypothetical protein